MLRTISFRPRTLCTINKNGMMFSVEESQCVVAQAYLRTTLFTSFEYNYSAAPNKDNPITNNDDEMDTDDATDELTQVALPLDSLIECLTLFYGPSGSASHNNQSGPTISNLSATNPLDLRGATTVQIGYKGEGNDFEMMLEERGTISVCRLATFVPEPPVDLEFSRYPVIQQLIIRSEWLRDAFDELDPTSESVTIAIATTAPHFRIATVGENGSTEMTYSKDNQILDSFFCTEEQENRYKLPLILKCRQALALSGKTKVKVNQRGFLTLQFMVPTDVDVSFVDFVFAPLIHADDANN
ncbi:checkpoint clamp complex protein Rad1 [Linderina macrospora]|uniref:Checkpoint clamp complex protein Rad1 n=1 Tax=Linderina macrospora TaxID=4868 RepID=A0ACC1J428_9FUNG|nr:checkpoint clamp complex protein Rad1 [Linderina macrospora]